jgi:alanine racemase
MKYISHPSWIEIDLKQFKKNLEIIRQKIGTRLFCLPVKANAYGHGLVQMSLTAQEFGVDMIAVSCLQEGIELRRSGITCPILVFGAIHEDQIDLLIDYRLEFSISSKFKADLVASKNHRKPCRVHLEVDTGMHRTGMRPETALQLFEQMRRQPCFEIVGIYSHLATADEPNHPFVQTQIDAFSALKQQIDAPNIIWHLANSGGVYYYPDSYFDMVRPGLLCYGLTPDGSEDPHIRPFFSLKARISYFKVVASGQGISYGHLYKTKNQTRIVTIPVGYGDGYCRSLSNKSSVLIRGKQYIAAGRICMDQFMVDIGSDEAYVGEEALLVGTQGETTISLWDLAKQASTDPREILCRFNDRIPRIYIS